MTAALILISAFFAISELSLAASRKIRLEQMVEEGDSRAQDVINLQAKPGKFFTVIQIGLNAVAILAGIIGNAAFSPYLASLFKLFLSADAAENLGGVCSFLIVTLAFVLFADLIPKRIAMVSPEALAVRVVRPMKTMIVLFAPVVWIFNGISSWLLRLLGLPTKRDESITSEDIIATVDAGTAAGVLAPTEQAVIENVFELESRLVPSAMTAREDIVYLLLDDTEDDVRRKATATPRDVYPICDGTLDHIIGTVSSKSLLSLAFRGEKISLRESLSKKDVQLIEPAQFVPDSLTLSEMLEFFKHKSVEFAVVLNEYALTVGVISINDVVRTVMADLVPTQEDSQILQRDEHSWLVDGATPVDDLEHTLGIESMPEESTYETVAGFMMFMLRKIPMRTDHFDWEDFRFEVIDVDHNKISQILVTRLIDGEMPVSPKRQAAAQQAHAAAPAQQASPKEASAQAKK